MANEFPFHKIEPGSNVVFYGAGNNAENCYKKLIGSGYCNLVKIVDKSPVGKSVAGIEVSPVESLFESSFDHVFITIVNKDIVKQVMPLLQAMGVSENKIASIYDREKSISIVDLCKIEEMRSYLKEKYSLLHRYVKTAKEYYPKLARLMENHAEEKEQLLGGLKQLLLQLECDEATLILLCLMYEYNVFDNECMCLYMKCIKEIPWKDDTFYGLTVDSMTMAFLHKDYIYDDFYLDRKTIDKKICEYYGLYDVPGPEKTVSNENKIALVVRSYTPYMIIDAIPKIVQKYAVDFAKAGYYVKLFVLCADVRTEDANAFLRKLYGVDTVAERALEEDPVFSGLPIEIELSKEKDIKSRLQGTIRRIKEFNPQCILDISSEAFPEAHVLINSFPIIELPMQAASYSSEADVHIVTDIDAVMEDTKAQKTMLREKLRKVKKNDLGLHFDTTKCYERGTLGWRKEDYIIITVGLRINIELDEELQEHMCDLLEAEENFCWILVGDKLEKQSKRFQKLVESKQIILWGYEEQLEALYAICDVYLNLKRRGGGVSMKLAMQQGMPIVTLDIVSDMSAFLPVGYAVHGGYKELMKLLKRMHTDQELYKKYSEMSKEVMEDLRADSDCEKILAVCKEVVSMRKKEGEKLGQSSI